MLPFFAFAAIQKPVIGQLNLLNKVWPVTVEDISLSHPLYGQSLQSLWNDPERMLLTYESQSQPQSVGLMAAMLAGKRLEAGDRIIWAELQKAKSVRWSFRRMIATALRGFNQFRAFSRSMMLILSILLATIGIAITTYVISNHGTSIVDALYFSVGMITGAGGQEAVAEGSSAMVKISHRGDDVGGRWGDWRVLCAAQRFYFGYTSSANLDDDSGASRRDTGLFVV